MKNSINAIDAGLLFGILFGVFHLSWLILVYLKYAQQVLDFLYWAHFIKPILEIDLFEPGRAVTLLILTVCCGFVLGLVVAKLLNTLLNNEPELE